MNARNAALAPICSAEEEGLNDIDKELEEAVEKEMGVLPLPKHRRRTKSFRILNAYMAVYEVSA